MEIYSEKQYMDDPSSSNSQEYREIAHRYCIPQYKGDKGALDWIFQRSPTNFPRETHIDELHRANVQSGIKLEPDASMRNSQRQLFLMFPEYVHEGHLRDIHVRNSSQTWSASNDLDHSFIVSSINLNNATSRYWYHLMFNGEHLMFLMRVQRLVCSIQCLMCSIPCFICRA